MRLARERISDRSIRSAGVTAGQPPQGSTRILPRCPHARRTVPDTAALPIAGQGTKSCVEMRGDESGRAEARHIQLRIGLRETVAATEGGDCRILAGELA